MYFWNYRALANDLKNNAVPKDSVIGYALLFGIWMIYNVFLLLLNTEQSPHDDFAATFFNYASWVVPIAVAYYINRQGDNAAFIKRYVCLFLPIFVRMLLLSLIFLPIMILYIFPCFQQRETELMDTCFAEKLNTSLFMIIGFLGLVYNVYLSIKAFRIAAGKEAAA